MGGGAGGGVPRQPRETLVAVVRHLIQETDTVSAAKVWSSARLLLGKREEGGPQIVVMPV